MLTKLVFFVDFLFEKYINKNDTFVLFFYYFKQKKLLTKQFISILDLVDYPQNIRKYKYFSSIYQKFYKNTLTKQKITFYFELTFFHKINRIKNDCFHATLYIFTKRNSQCPRTASSPSRIPGIQALPGTRTCRFGSCACTRFRSPHCNR